jgi:hypothetical protein
MAALVAAHTVCCASLVSLTLLEIRRRFRGRVIAHTARFTVNQATMLACPWSSNKA